MQHCVHWIMGPFVCHGDEWHGFHFYCPIDNKMHLNSLTLHPFQLRAFNRCLHFTAPRHMARLFASLNETKLISSFSPFHVLIGNQTPIFVSQCWKRRLSFRSRFCSRKNIGCEQSLILLEQMPRSVTTSLENEKK